jgi:hypothetical protein
MRRACAHSPRVGTALLLENERVRAWDFSYPPGGPAGGAPDEVHQHTLDYVFCTPCGGPAAVGGAVRLLGYNPDGSLQFDSVSRDGEVRPAREGGALPRALSKGPRVAPDYERGQGDRSRSGNTPPPAPDALPPRRPPPSTGARDNRHRRRLPPRRRRRRWGGAGAGPRLLPCGAQRVRRSALRGVPPRAQVTRAPTGLRVAALEAAPSSPSRKCGARRSGRGGGALCKEVCGSQSFVWS